MSEVDFQQAWWAPLLGSWKKSIRVRKQGITIYSWLGRELFNIDWLDLPELAASRKALFWEALSLQSTQGEFHIHGLQLSDLRRAIRLINRQWYFARVRLMQAQARDFTEFVASQDVSDPEALSARLDEVSHWLNLKLPAIPEGLLTPAETALLSNARRDLLQAREGVKDWYRQCLPEIEQFQSRVDAFFAKAGYCRSSRWADILPLIRQEAARLPPIPAPATLTPREDEILANAALWLTPEVLLERGRQVFIQRALEQFRHLFDTVEQTPLSDQQRLACVTNEDRNLVVAGAGTGKTSTVIGRAAYLVMSGLAKPHEILMLAFGNKVAKEMKERLKERTGISGVRVGTFHSIGKDICSTVAGRSIDPSPLASDGGALRDFFQRTFDELRQDEAYQSLLVGYFMRYLFPEVNPFEFESLGDYYKYLKDHDLISLNLDPVKGYGECCIANFLYTHGVAYQYEAVYQYATSELASLADPMRNRYKPDFFLPEHGIYIEHFGIDRQGNTAPFIDRDEYHDGMAWKRSVHERNGTTLIQTYHYELTEGRLLASLKQQLVAHGVALNPIPPDAILARLDERKRTNITRFLLDLHKLLKALNLDADALEAKVRESDNPQQLSRALELLAPITAAYEAELSRNQQIDFDDMINLAVEHAASGRFKSPWTHIIVDEHQDIAPQRVRLVKALLAQHPRSVLFSVGDDWQSIFRFTGSDIRYTTEFERNFGPTALTPLDITYRFDSSLNETASAFVKRNPAQLQKSLKTMRAATEAAVSLFPTTDSLCDVLEEVLGAIERRSPSGATVYILSRFNRTLPDKSQVAALNRQFPGLTIECKTAHGSKGAQADYIIIGGLTSGEYGFPSEKLTDPLLDSLLPDREAFPFAEERRLFYVALTRAKKRAYLIYDFARRSRFVTELLEHADDLELDEFTDPDSLAPADQADCPSCGTGRLVLRKNRSTGKHFFACSNSPYCDYTERACPKCGTGVYQLQGIHRVCSNHSCDAWVPVCRAIGCGRDMVRRPNGETGKLFWGCSSYPVSKCKYTVDFIVPPASKRGMAAKTD